MPIPGPANLFRGHQGSTRVGLFPKIAGTMVLVATIPLIVALFVTTGILRDRQEKAASQSLVRLNRQVGGEVSRAIDAGQSALGTLAGIDIISDRSVPMGVKELTLRSFDLPNTGGLVLLDLSGKVLISTSKDDVSFLKDNDVVANARDGQPAFSEMDTAPGQETASLIHAAPVIDSRGQWAVLVAEPVRPETVGRIMRETRIGNQGYSFVLNADNQIVAHRFPSRLLSAWTEGSSLVKASTFGAGWVTQSGRRWLCVFEEFSISQKLGKPWKSVTCQPHAEVFADLASSQRVLIWSVLGSLTLALVAGFAVSRSMTKPITALAASARMIQGGRLDQRADVSSRDEVGELAASFNEMAESLAQKIDQIEQERVTLAAIQASMAEGLVVLDARGQVAEINRAAEDLTGLTPGEATGKPGALVLREALRGFGPSETMEAFLACSSSPASSVLAFQLARESNRPLHIQLTVFPIRFAREGRMTGILLRDTTQERELERRRNTFVSVASHELRTPLTNMMGYAELLLSREPPPQRRKQWLQNIYEGTRKLAILVEDLLNLSRIQSGKVPVRKERVPVEGILKTALTSVQTITEKHEFVLETEPGIPDMFADGDKLVQVLTNLLDNAVKYSPKGGRITLAAVHEKSQDRVVLSVTDEGMGIALEDQEKLFNTFQRISRPGTEDIRGSGLGLYIVKELLRLMDGDVWVKSQPEKGSTFFVSVPIAPNEAGS